MAQGMENARRILAELEALKRQLLERYPEAAPAPDAPASSDAAAQAAVTDGDELPGQVAAHGEGAPPATRGAGPASAAVADAVQQELSKRMDTLRSQVWQEIVREELARLESSRLADEQGGSPGAHEQGGTPRAWGHGAHGSAKRRSHVVGAYNADYVLGAVDGYAHRDRLHDQQHDASRHSLHSGADNQRTSAAVHSARAKEGGGEDAGDSAAPPGEEDEAKASAPNGEILLLAEFVPVSDPVRSSVPGGAADQLANMTAGDAAGSTDDDEDADEEWVSVSENAYGAFIHVGLQSGTDPFWSRAALLAMSKACIGRGTRVFTMSFCGFAAHFDSMHGLLMAGLLQAWRKCCTMLIVSIVIAFIFALELIQRHQFFFDRYTDKQGIHCGTPGFTWNTYQLVRAREPCAMKPALAKKKDLACVAF